MSSKRTFIIQDKIIVIGDLHGQLTKAQSLWNNLTRELGKKELENEYAVVFLGDYVDRGGQEKELIEWLIALRDSRPTDSTYFLLGNHDHGKIFVYC